MLLYICMLHGFQGLSNGYKEEVYVAKPSSFENHEFSNHVFKLSKTLYDLK